MIHRLLRELETLAISVLDYLSLSLSLYMLHDGAEGFSETK